MLESRLNPSGAAIYKITVPDENKASVSLFAGQRYGCKLEDGPVATAGLNLIKLTTDRDGNIIYAADGFARFIGKIDLASGAITSIAGRPYKRQWCPVYTQGDASKAEFVDPASAIVTNKKGEILLNDQRINRILNIAVGKVSTLAGGNIFDPCSQNCGGRSQEGNRDGKALTSLVHFPNGMAYDSKGNLFIADLYNHSIRKLSPDGMVSTFAK